MQKNSRREPSALNAAFLLFNIFMIAVLPLAACTGKEEKSVSNSSAPAADEKKQPTDTGDFKVVYAQIKNAEYVELEKELRESKLLETIAADLNDTIALPFDIVISFDECNEVNAFYDPEKRQISICLELIEDLNDVFQKKSDSEDEAIEATLNATIFVFFHELGHALVHALKLPITGKEEDAVDQLSTFILADGTDEGAQAALDGAESFLSDEDQMGDLPFWDEHSLGPQRFFNIVCWVYGQNPAKYASLVNNALPEQRAVRCEEEYKQIEKSWSTLLAPYMKK